MLTINTHMGLFHYRHLLFCIATACNVAENHIYDPLTLQEVVYYIDDILVTDWTQLDHEENQKFFTTLEYKTLNLINKDP